MKKLFLSLAAVALLSGFSAKQPQPTVHHLTTPFDAKFAAQQMETGSASVSGTAFLRQQGGEAVTCAGQAVVIIPVTGYATERISKIHGSTPNLGQTIGKDVSVILQEAIEFIPEAPAYNTTLKATKCDAQGEFLFEGMKDGLYYILTSVMWTVGALQGEQLASQVKVENGQSQKLIMAP